MTGLKINYHKSEVIVFVVDEDIQDRITNALNCKVGSLPMNYLGLPITDRELGIKRFDYLGAKLRKKLQPWKGKHMSYGGRLILSNTSLSSLPIYTMAMFLLKAGSHQKMDTIRAQFFWRVASDKFKYHMLKWENITFP